MKGKILKLRNLLTMAILVACLIGCGDQEATTTEPTTEVEEPTVTEKPTDEADSEKVEEKEEEPTNEEVQEEPTTEMVDWETFAAQADNNEICIAILNETTKKQEVVVGSEMEETYLYRAEKGDRIFIPLRDSIYRICYITIIGQDIGEVEDIYWKNESDGTEKFIEFEIRDGENYNIQISNEKAEGIHFFIDNAGSN